MSGEVGVLVGPSETVGCMIGIVGPSAGNQLSSAYKFIQTVGQTLLSCDEQVFFQFAMQYSFFCINFINII